MLKRRRLLFLLLLVFFEAKSNFSYENILDRSIDELLEKGDHYFGLNQLDTALTCYMSIIQKYEGRATSENKQTIIESYLKIGNIFNQQSNYHNALDFYLRALRMSEKENTDGFMPEIYINMGNIYNRFSEYEKGKSSYLQGLKLAREQGKTEMEWKILNNLVSVCCDSYNSDEDVEEAKYYYKESINIPLENNNLQKYYYYFSQAYIHSRESKLDSAIINYKKSLDYAVDAGLDSYYQYYSSSLLAIMLRENKEYDKALEYNLYAYQITQENEMIDETMYSLKNLYNFHRNMGNKEKADIYKIKYLTMQDSLFNIRDFNRIKNLQLAYETEKVIQEIDILNSEKEKNEIQLASQKRILLIVSMSLLGLLVFLILVYIQKTKLKKAYVDLFERNSQIIESDIRNRRLRKEYEKRLKEKNGQLSHVPVKRQEDNLILHPLQVEKQEEGLDKHIILTDEQKEKLMDDINDIMENSYEFCDCDFNLNRLATLVGSNTKYVSYIINEAYNKNFRSYINEYRIKEASIRLMDTENYGHYTIKAIAESVGYKSHTTFINMFKKSTGINPSTFQKIAKKQPSHK